jgi:hypothetical protein
MTQRFFVLAFSFLLFTGALHAQHVTAGKHFLFAIPYNDGSQFAADPEIEFYISSVYENVHVTVEYMGSGDKRTYKTGKPYSVLTLSSTRNQLSPVWEVTQSESEQVLSKVVEITSDQDITVNVLYARTVSSDGWRPMPVHLWGTQYRAVSYYDFKELGGNAWAGGFVIVASEDNTDVNITLAGVTDGSAKTVGGRKPGDAISVTLEKGQCYAVIGDGTSRGVFDLTGSLVEASKPVSLIGFHARTTMPNCVPNGNGRDHLIENIPPLHAWAKEYVTVNYLRTGTGASSGSGDVFRIVASEDNTTWTLKYYDRVSKNLIGQDSGVLEKAGEFETIQACSPSALPTGVSVWTADKPVMLMQYATSANWDGDTQNDPFMIGVQSTDQMVYESVFQSPMLQNYYKHYFNIIVRAENTDDLKTLTIDGVPVWSHPRANNPKLLNAQVPGTNDLYYASIDFDTEAKAHVVTSNGEVSFAGYVHGVGSVDSYGYPAAGQQANLDAGDGIKPVIASERDQEWTWTANDQGGAGLGGVQLLPSSRNATLNFDSNSVSTFQITRPVNAASGYIVAQHCDSTIVADVVVWDFAGNRTRAQYTRPPMLLGVPSMVNAGAHMLGTTTDVPVTVRNMGGDTLDVYRIDVTGSNAFRSAPLTTPIRLQPGDSTRITVTYAPTRESTGPTDFDEATLRINDCGNLTVLLRGLSSTPALVIEDRVDTMMTVLVGTTRCDSHCVVVRNISLAPVTVMSVSMTQHSEITLSDIPMIELQLQPGEAKPIGTICYSPTNEGADTTTLTVATNGSSSTAWSTLIRRRGVLPSSVTEPLDLPSDVTIVDNVVHAREHAYTVTVYDLLGRVLQTGVVRPGEALKIMNGYVVVQKP